jgi:hypothetical protein
MSDRYLTHLGSDIGEAIEAVARQLKWLGNGDAATHFGAIEAHGIQVEKAGNAIYNGLSEVAQALENLADAVLKSAGKI